MSILVKQSLAGGYAEIELDLEGVLTGPGWLVGQADFYDTEGGTLCARGRLSLIAQGDVVKLHPTEKFKWSLVHTDTKLKLPKRSALVKLINEQTRNNGDIRKRLLQNCPR
jgi:hypothetical protein